MTTIIIIAGVLIIAIGTLVFWYGGSLKSSQEIANLQKTIDVQTDLINELQKETDRLKNLGNIQLKTIYYTEELNQKVKAIFLRFKLKESIDFSDLCPVKFGFQFSYSFHTELSFRKLITDVDARNNDDVRLNAYNIYDISQEDKPTINHHFMDIHKRPYIDDILLQVFVSNEMKGIVRDFHDKQLLVYFPINLYEKIESIELIVNGWIVLNQEFTNVDWRIDKSQWLSLKGEDVDMYQAINKGPHEDVPHAEWTINLYDKLPDYNKELSSTIYFGDLVNGLNMLHR